LFPLPGKTAGKDFSQDPVANAQILVTLVGMLLCFDYDGVLVDSLSQQFRLVCEAQRRLAAGRIPVRGDFATIEDLSYDGFARHIGIPTDKWPEWRALAMDLLASDKETPPVFPDVLPVVAELGTRFPIAIITSNVRDVVERCLREEGLSSYVENIFDGKMRGSKAEKLMEAAKKSGIPISSTYMIGDTRGDLRHARTAGAKSIACGWGYQSREALSAENPDFFAAIPRELLTYFGTLEVH
jgi:phosphoglycolate phosphatase-like HAD superfamily hydrolase